MTDVSLSGWGATITSPPHQIAGLWDPQERLFHINVLEMLAVSRALLRFQNLVTERAVRIRCDNATVVAYINHQGGTRSGLLCLLTWELLHWCILHRVVLSAVYLQGSKNHVADALSRGTMVPTEWTLLPSVVQSIFSLIDRPHVDLFATADNAQLPVYCTRTPNPKVWETDAHHSLSSRGSSRR